MERQKPDTSSNEIDLYIRTYYSLLRSSGEVRVRSFEEAHSYSNSSLHAGAREPVPDIAAFRYAAGRLPEVMPGIDRVVLGQADQIFQSFGYEVGDWELLHTRGRRRRLRHDGRGTLAAYISSASDIDDLLPIITAYQIEWNKLHALLAEAGVGGELAGDEERWCKSLDLAAVLRISEADAGRLREALGSEWPASLSALATRPLDLRVRLLAGSFSAYQRAATMWWDGVEREAEPAHRPVYFVSSNTHALANLLGGYALAHAEQLLETARREHPDGVDPLELPQRPGSPAAPNLLYFALRTHLQREPGALAAVQAWDRDSGIVSVENRAHVDVAVQVIDLAGLRPERLDPRLSLPGLDVLSRSDARIINIDYPLGMAAYHLLSQVGRGVSPLLGVYVMGKAATLNGQIGDVLISHVVHDEHSDNTYLLNNAFAADDLIPYMDRSSVLDNQKAVTVRGPFLQNPNYMGVFYREGYTVLEMEAGPYLSAIYELVDPRRHPKDQIVNLSERGGFDVGILHYASDTPYSRRQTLLSKSLGAFGVESTYACAIAITRRILEREISRLALLGG
ncbi:MAG: hypothetical protein V3V67_08265 [Myxococcota bacterium]